MSEECLADMAAAQVALLPAKSPPRRGQHAFAHPEWERPWRSKSQQRHAEEMSAKEIEAETQVRKNHILRRQIQVTQAQLRKETAEKQADIVYLEEEHKLLMRKKDEEFQMFKEETSHREMALKRQLANLQRSKDTEQKAKDSELKELQLQLAGMTEEHSRAVAALNRSSRLEIGSLTRIIEAKDKELTETKARSHKDALEAMAARDAACDALVQQLHEADENWRQALDEQQNRSNDLRKEDILRAEALEARVKEANEKGAELQRKVTTLERKIGTLETEATGWANRLMSHVDVMINSYTTPPPTVTILPKDKPSNPVHERLWYKMQQLWTMLQEQHEQGKKALDEKEDRDEEDKKAKRQERERWEERRREIVNLEQELDDVRTKQERIAHAFEDLRRHADEVEQSERYLTHRLQYFIEDAIISEESRNQPSAPPAPSPGTITVVFLSAMNVPLVFEKQLFKAAMDTFNKVVRTKAHLRGGYEAACKGDGFLFLFQNIAEACQFALDVQLGLYTARWPPALLSHTDINGSDENWNGVRCKIAIHHGTVLVCSRAQ
eukprot:TRINITY_DN9983_c0_g1_i1.p1 TRINITY_DN9983_c0_g1~~TRINITY_DN9983_c0_g1_i1.p1  ORF type:complete len:563 (+),score=227.13 TRINITY_DN9983_c0_g1_i1:27-1691(+)